MIKPHAREGRIEYKIDSRDPDLVFFYEKYEDGTYLKLKWTRLGSGGEYEEEEEEIVESQYRIAPGKVVRG